MKWLIDMLGIFGRAAPRVARSHAKAEPCTCDFGNRGSGKSEGLAVDLLRIAKDRKSAVVLLDLPGTGARKSAGHLWSNGMQSRLLFEEARRTDRVLSWPFIEPLDLSDPLKEEDNRLRIEEFLLAFWSQRNIKGTDAQAKPWTKKYAVAAARVYASQPALHTLDKIDSLFRLGDPEREAMLTQAKDQDAARMFREAELRAGRNPIQWEAETGAAQRLLEVVKSPVVWARHGKSLDWKKVIRDKMQVYFDLSGITTETARALSIFVSNAVINACKQLFEESGQAHPVVLVLEECGYLDLATPLFLDAMRAWRKAGFSGRPLSQTLDDFKDPAVLETLLALCDVHHYYRLNSGIERAAKDLAAPTYDPLAVHYTRTRKQLSHHEEVTTKSKGKTKDEHGHERRDEREATSLRPVYENVTDTFYKSEGAQEAEYKRKLAVLLPGERVTRDLEGVRSEKVTMLGEPWPLGLTAAKTERMIEEIRARAEYQPPPSSPAPLPPPPPLPSPSPATVSAPKRKYATASSKTTSKRTP